MKKSKVIPLKVNQQNEQGRNDLFSSQGRNDLFSSQGRNDLFSSQGRNDLFSSQETLKQLSEGLDSLDSLQINTPSQKWIENFVLEQKQKAKEKWRKEIFLFSLVAIFILSGIIFSLYQMPIIFIILQGLGITFIVIYSTFQLFKQVKSYE